MEKLVKILRISERASDREEERKSERDEKKKGERISKFREIKLVN